jgi:hypothetical protein
MKWLQFIREWSEVWALFIPLVIILIYRPKGNKTGWLITYVLVALFLNSASTVMAQFYGYMPSWLKNNNIVYNAHSIVRVFFFSIYIMSVRSYQSKPILKYLLILYVVFVIVNFSFFEPILFLSPNLFAAESIVLLIMCLSYFFRSMQDESETYWLRQPSFLVCSGICFYEVITFFVFLFFNTINYSTEYRDRHFSDILLLIYTISYVILCILLAIALYKNRKSLSH